MLCMPNFQSQHQSRQRSAAKSRPAEVRKLSGNMEDYLEAIYNLSRDQGFARSKDIAQQMGVLVPSVTGALRTLAARELILYEPYSVVRLTAQGEKIARRMVRRHNTLRTFLERFLGVTGSEADDNACRMEHAVSPAVMDRLMAFIDFVDQAPEVRRRWLENFVERAKQDEQS